MKRHHVVLDTNVLISAILFGGKPREILNQVISGQIDCTLSLDILNELIGVLQRPKFGFTAEQCIQIVEELHRTCNIIATTTKLKVKISDLDDKVILECAIEAKADFIISGVPDLTELHPFRKINILTPSNYLKQSNTNIPG
jgi:uncharacterized protein